MHEHFENMILPFFGNMNIEDIDHGTFRLL